MSPYIAQDDPVDLSMKSRRKLRLDEFLRLNLDQAPAGRVIQWVDRPSGVFRILWTHQSSGAFTHEDATLFRYWALARGKASDLSSVELKQSLRMALNKSPSVVRLSQTHDEYRYFRFTEWGNTKDHMDLDGIKRENVVHSSYDYPYEARSENLQPHTILPHWVGDSMHSTVENMSGIHHLTNSYNAFNRCSPEFGETTNISPKDMSFLTASNSIPVQDVHLVPNSDIHQRSSHYLQGPPPLIDLNYGYHDAHLVPGSSPDTLNPSFVESSEHQYEYSEPERTQQSHLYSKIDSDYRRLKNSLKINSATPYYNNYDQLNERNYSYLLEHKKECLDCEFNNTYPNIHRTNCNEQSESLSKNTRKSSTLWNPMFTS